MHFFEKSGDKKYNKKVIEFIMKTNEFNFTALHYAAEKGNKDIINSFLNVFNTEENKTLISKYLMIENDFRKTVLHISAENGDTQIVKSFLNAFGENENEKLIKFVMKEDEGQQTALHYSSKYGYKKISKSLLNVFGEKKTRRINYLYIKRRSTKTQRFTLCFTRKSKVTKYGHFSINLDFFFV